MSRPSSLSEPDLLSRVTVRLIKNNERERFDSLIEERHDLHSAILVGEHLRYVAELDGPWIALPADRNSLPNLASRVLGLCLCRDAFPTKTAH